MCVSAQFAGAQTVESVLTKMKSAAEAMKTYQATFLMTTDGGDNGNMTLEMKL